MKKLTLFFGALCVSIVAFGQMKVQPDGTVIAGQAGEFKVQPDGTVIAGQLKVQPDGTVIAGYDSDAGSTYTFGLGKPVYMYTLPVGPNAGQDVYSTGRWCFQIGGGVSPNPNYLHIKRGDASSLAYGLYMKDHIVGIGKIPIDNAKLDVNGSIYVNGSTLVASDERFKSDIRGIDNLVPRIYELNGKSYQKRLPDSTETFFEYGFLAQELQRQFPDLVVRTSDDYLAVNYVALIPVIVEALKSQKREIDELYDRIDALERMLNFNAAPNNAPPKAPQQETTGETVAALYQNTPNPFNENTEIAFYLPQSVTNAMLCVYDMNGKQLSQNIITQRGNASFVVSGNQYGAGMYLYSLIADNQIVDTKRMILTK